MTNLQDQDPKIYKLIQQELARQRGGLEMIASENFVSPAILEAMGSVLTNKYAEGYPGKRYYGGNEFIDQIEQTAIDRAKEIFGAEHVNVQPHSGAQANEAAYFSVLNPGDTVLAMDLGAGGHLTHGLKINFSGRFYNFVSYGVSHDTQTIDFDEVRSLALAHKPKLILAGASAYSRQIDFTKFKQITDEVGAYFMVDMAHIAGLVAAKLHPDPLPLADIVTTTTHKTLRGPRGAVIFSKTNDHFDPDNKKTLAQKIDSAVFPGLQGGPLEHIIAAKAVGFAEALQPEFKLYQQQVLANAKVLENIFREQSIAMVSDGTDNHLLLLDLSILNISGLQAQAALEKIGVYTNKNMIPGETRKPTDPSGLRLGTPALTTRGLRAEEMTIIGEIICSVLKNIDNEKTFATAKQKVDLLAQQFPLYPDLN